MYEGDGVLLHQKRLKHLQLRREGGPNRVVWRDQCGEVFVLDSLGGEIETGRASSTSRHFADLRLHGETRGGCLALLLSLSRNATQASPSQSKQRGQRICLIRLSYRLDNNSGRKPLKAYSRERNT